jgi:hypothetical protein
MRIPAIRDARHHAVSQPRWLFSLSLCAAVMICGPSVARCDESAAPPIPAARVEGDAVTEQNVGLTARIEQVVWSGSELTTKVVDANTTAIVLRIDAVYPHGDGFRYDVTWTGMEPGQFNLADYVSRIDGSSTDDLAPLSVTVKSVLPPDRIKPNPPNQQQRVSVGGYSTLVMAAAVCWLTAMIVVLLLRRQQRPEVVEQQHNTPLSRLQQIEHLLNEALETSEFNATSKARLEGLIVGFWSDLKGLRELAPQEALAQLSTDPETAPLLQQLERWLYDRPVADRAQLIALLNPFREMIDDMELRPGHTPESAASPDQHDDGHGPEDAEQSATAEARP